MTSEGRVPWHEGPAVTQRTVADVIYAMHGCSCDHHYSVGETATCEAWRRRAAERVAEELANVEAERG